MLSVIRGGVETALDDGTLSYYVGDDGFGMSPQHRLAERGPLQHGATDRGYRLDPRIGTLILELPGTSRPNLFDLRTQLLEAFAPADEPLKLRWELDEFTKQIDCHFDGEMSFPSDERRGFEQKTAISLFCPDPTFYDPTAKTQTVNLPEGGDQFTVGFMVGFNIGATVIDLTQTISYNGSWRSYPHLIRISGPITDPVITNTSTDEVLDFTGVTITAGNFYDIDLTYGSKTVVDQDGVNKIADLSDDSDFATWHIATSDEVPAGDNSIKVEGTNAAGQTQVSIVYFERYVGL